MTGIQAIGVLIIRVWAASVLLIYFFTSAVWTVDAAMGRPIEDFGRVVAEGAIWIAAAFAAWVFAPRIARLLVPRGAPDALQISMGADDFVAAGSFLIGGYLILSTAPQLAQSFLEIAGEYAARDTDALPTIASFLWARLIASALTFAVAVFLTLRPRQVASLFASLRQAGLAKVDSND